MTRSSVNGTGFRLARAGAIFWKELAQMRRDRLTFAMMVMIPLIQLTLFGTAINTDPRRLPTLIDARDDGPASRAVLQAMATSRYFRFTGEANGRADADDAFRSGRALFVLTIPENFERDLARGEHPQLLLDADATDPVASGAASGAFAPIAAAAVAPLLDGAPVEIAPTPPAVETIVHRRYNPAGRTAVNIVPGLLGVILTMTMTMMTALSLTRETERGTLETLLSAPVAPAEVMIGKILPYVFVGIIQVVIMLVVAHGPFRVPFDGDPLAFTLAIALFMLTNLSLGYLFSTLAKTQMQAMQMTFFVFLPSILLSGFMFPFQGMPAWARALGELIPNTHFIRAVRAVMLKGASFADVAAELLALTAALLAIATLAVLRYRRTLD
jgi:ABC-2 type transport system permease protein